MTTALAIIGEVPYADLPLSDRRRLLWGFLWRALCVTTASALLGFIAGFVIGIVGGMVAAAAGVPVTDYTLHLQVASGVLGFAIGLWLLTIYIRWLLRARFGSLRLALVRTSN